MSWCSICAVQHVDFLTRTVFAVRDLLCQKVVIPASDKLWSVYIHTNKANGKVYIGISSDIRRRWSNDGAEYLKKQSPFASAIRKYGWDGFNHSIVASCLTLDEANYMEKKLISKYMANINRFGRQYGYNQTDGGDGTSGFPQYDQDNPFYGRHHTKTAKEAISHANKGRFVGDKSAQYGIPLTSEKRLRISSSLKSWYAEHDSASCKPVKCITDGTWFSSVKEASEHYKIQSNEISAVCLGKRLSTHGLKFTYSDDGTEPEYKRKGVGRETQAKIMREAKSIPVRCVETDRIYKSAKIAAEATGINSRGDISKCCKGKIKTAGGFHWQYAEVSQHEA